MIDEMLDRDLLGEFGKAAVMIAMPVRDDQIVDLGEMRIARRRKGLWRR